MHGFCKEKLQKMRKYMLNLPGNECGIALVESALVPCSV